jgi:hypothetical protein
MALAKVSYKARDCYPQYIFERVEIKLTFALATVLLMISSGNVACGALCTS